MAKEITKDIVNFVADEVTSGRVDERFSEVVCVLIRDYLDKHPVREIDVTRSAVVKAGIIYRPKRLATCELIFLDKEQNWVKILLGSITKARRVYEALTNMLHFKE